MIIKRLTNITAQNLYESLEKLSHLERAFIMTFDNIGKHGVAERFTYAGASPIIELKCDSRGAYLTGNKAIISNIKVPRDPFKAIDMVLENLNKISDNHSSPFPFSGGALGYFSYDLKDLIEKDKFHNKKSPSGTPLMDLGFYDSILVYDHKKNEAYLISIGLDKSGNTFKTISETLENKTLSNSESMDITFGEATSNMTKDEYINKISEVKKYIEAGDIYQINISQMFTIPMNWETKNAPYSLYNYISTTHRSSFSNYIDFGSFQIISNSPERLMSVKNRGGNKIITTEPIKGTIGRGIDSKVDNELKVALRGNAKECAEHVMIVDLERNDLGKICRAGTVTVTEFQKITTYPNLHHMVSTIEGTLREDVTTGDSIREMFPGGSITGAPKVRAMEIIDSLEPTNREIYTGAIGYINLNGEMDLSMAIRTAVIKDGALHINVGGGIVADSISEKEYEETILKAKDFTDTIKKINKKTNQKSA